MAVTYEALENRYGEAIAQYLVKEIEKAAKISAANDNWDFEARLLRAQQYKNL